MISTKRPEWLKNMPSSPGLWNDIKYPKEDFIPKNKIIPCSKEKINQKLQITDFTNTISFNKVKPKNFYHVSHYFLEEYEMYDITQIKTKKFLGKTLKHGTFTVKPIGIWFAKGKDWINEFDNMYEFDKKSDPVYQVNPNFQCYEDPPEPDKVLYIENEEQLVDFIVKYKFANDYDPAESFIRWDVVSKKYAGIYFACRNQYPGWLMPSWFSALDINSGCCWRMSGFINRV
jgi:hypothetical protein